MKTLGAVITADIVNSTGLGSETIAALGSALECTLHEQGAVLLSYYRGDSFQAYLNSAISALRLALLLRCETRLLGYELSGMDTDLKVSLCIGDIEMPVNPKTAHDEAFVRSGTGLDALERRGHRLLLQSIWAEDHTAMQSISLFADYLLGALTGKQTAVLRLLLMGQNQSEIARTLGKSQSTINKHIQAMGWKYLEELLVLYTKVVSQKAQRYG